MKTFTIAAAVLAATLATGGAAQARGTIEKACLASDRKAVSRALCGCIQDVADITLSSGEQQLAAKFFKDPDLAQEIRQSDRRSHELFWEKYKNFGATAETYCS